MTDMENNNGNIEEDRWILYLQWKLLHFQGTQLQWLHVFLNFPKINDEVTTASKIDMYIP